MSSLKNIKLVYDYNKRSWLLNRRRKKWNKTLYWGSHMVPFPVSNRTPESDRNAITFNSCYRVTKNSVQVGPLIGILTVEGNNFPFTGNRKNFQDLIKKGQEKGAIVFVFTPQNIDWSRERIMGWIFDSDQKIWKRVQFPFPNVVYNRVSTRKKESSPEVQQAIKMFNQYSKITLFNEQFFNKQEVYQLLKESSEIKRFLPETQTLKSKKQLFHMLQKYPFVYLKPTNGKAGLGILKISYDSYYRVYKLVAQLPNQILRINKRNIERVWGLYKKFRTSSPYIIQQGIMLEEINGNPFDFRILVQKNYNGQWDVTGVGIRVAGKESITTHVPRGGRIENPLQILSSIYPNQAQHVMWRLQALALLIARELEPYYTHLGEMSMDIGLDQQGKLWFFEANSKPMKFDEPNIRAHSLQNLIEYCQYLTFK